eukprot:s2267_g9.t1
MRLQKDICTFNLTFCDQGNSNWSDNSAAQPQTAMQIVAPSRFLDGVVFAVFLLFVSGAGLYIFGEFHKMCVITEAKKLGVFADIMDKAQNPRANA